MPHPKLFLLALSFYTRMPCPQNLDYKLLPQAAVYLPAIGCLVGGVSAVSYWLSDMLWPPTVAVIVSIVAGILMTGAFHEDGFADVCDGFGGGWDKQHILTIMKDSQIGTYGAVGLILMLLLKIALLSSMPASWIPLQFVAGHSISRLPPLLLMRRYTYARTDNSKCGTSVFKPGNGDMLFSAGLALLPFIWLPVYSLFTVIPILIVTWYLGRYFNRHIGGYTGDCLGASQQIAETVFYLSITALWTFI